MFNTGQTNSQFHFEMLQKYYAVFKKIDTENLSPSFLAKLEQQIVDSETVSKEEKRLHQDFIQEFLKINEEIKTLHWMSKHLKVLHDLGQTFSHTFEKDKIYEKAYELVSSVMDTDAFIIALYREGEQEFHIPFRMDNGVSYEPVSYSFGTGIVSTVIKNRSTVHIRNGQEAFQHAEGILKWGNPEQNTETCIFVPMILNNQIKGVISAQNYRQFAYRIEHEELLSIIGVQVASAIETATLYDKVYEMSVKDDLTKIKNSRKFHLDLEKKTKSANDQPISLIMLDSDSLKKINDRYGHHVGDQLIQYISEVLLKHLKEGEEAYRYAGDEFMIITPVTDIQALLQKTHEIQEFLQNNPLDYNGEYISSTISVGIAQFPMDTTNGDELKRLADMAMYRSKKNGKNTVTLYSELHSM
ncbi:sensor domain-containing diguanylate cyclase [Bacillus horti]|uniref:Diguanylate cyclase (GGDEF)-like protein n=1 Tax=Caldalkalibacillus horti TaxID=77523 RepID=A0ABT9W402_9BACI|nr:sensor domain-containing diguanylate cyclase [Bacillus horti]MDQ0167979.1 diguanylate cyclase (GGDEF)-like protein [Bacillus horti]